MSYSLRSRPPFFGKHFDHWGIASIWDITFLVELPARLLLALSHRSAEEVLDTVHGYALTLRLRA